MTDFTFSTGSVADVRADLLVLPVFGGPDPGPGVKEAGLAGSFAAGKLTGKEEEQLLITEGHRAAAGAVLLLGIGERRGIDANRLRVVLAKAAPTMARFGTVATTFPQTVTGRGADAALQATAEGIVLGSYRFDRYRTTATDLPKPIRKVTVIGGQKADARGARAALDRGRIIAEGVNWARDLVNTPAGDLPPAQLAREAQKMAREVGLTCKVWGEAELKRGGFGGILGVGAGSVNPPRMIELSYKGTRSGTPIALSGKGIAFDSGGLSIKDAKNMETMKDDMAGAASILATMRVLAELKPKANVIAAIPCSENMPSGSATKPGDVLVHRGGKTSEVLNTDAEGRLVLADSLAYLTEKRPQVIIDTATLTGSCMVALGEDIAGAMGTDAGLIRDVLAAGEAVDEPFWELPLWAGYKRQIESPIADVKNVGDRWGGAITAALFLAEFVGDVPWVHLDIAGPAFRERPYPLGPRGATGFPVRTLVRYVLDRAAG